MRLLIFIYGSSKKSYFWFPRICGSSIEHGDTKTFSNMYEFLLDFCVTILWYFCEVLFVAGVLYCFPCI